MLNKSIPKVILFHRTIAPEYDDRLNKIFATFDKFGISSAHAYLWDRTNTSRSGRFSHGGFWTLLKIPFGSKAIPRPGAIYTAYEIFVETFQSIRIIRRNRPNVIILQNHRMFLLAFFLVAFNKSRYRLIWDLRELPKGFYNNGILPRIFFAYLMENFDVVIATNEARKKFLEDFFGSRSLLNSIVLPNYPLLDAGFSSVESILLKNSEIYSNQPFIYIQSANAPSRYPYNSVKAALLATNSSVVVTGDFDQKALNDLKVEFGDVLEQRVSFLGYVSSMQIKFLLSKSLVSLIFYESTEPNNEFCEPNRLYQAISNGVPVIVGINQGLSRLVTQLKCGVILPDDGSSLSSVINAFSVLIKDYDKYKSNADAAKNKLSWEDVEYRLIESVLTL